MTIARGKNWWIAWTSAYGNTYAHMWPSHSESLPLLADWNMEDQTGDKDSMAPCIDCPRTIVRLSWLRTGDVWTNGTTTFEREGIKSTMTLGLNFSHREFGMHFFAFFGLWIIEESTLRGRKVLRLLCNSSQSGTSLRPFPGAESLSTTWRDDLVCF